MECVNLALGILRFAVVGGFMTVIFTQSVRLRWSDDGGHTWSNAEQASMGDVGQTAQRVIFRRIGSTRRNTGLDRIFEISSDYPQQVALIGASIGDG